MTDGSGLQRRIFRVPHVAAAGTTIQNNDMALRELCIDYFLIIHIVDGRRWIRRGHSECNGKAGDYILVTPGVYDTINFNGKTGPYRSDWLAWDAKLLSSQEPLASLSPFEGASVLPSFGNEFTHGFTEARRALEAAGALPTEVVKHRILEIILWLRHCGFPLAITRWNSLDRQIRAMVARSPSSDWSVAMLADNLAISEPTLRRRLSALGVTPKDLILSARMSNAIGLLQSTSLSISEIASKVGYESPPRFASRFKSKFGFSPSELRGHRRGHLSEVGNLISRSLESEV